MVEPAKIVSSVQEVIQFHIKDDGNFPNNENLPLLVYTSAVPLPKTDPATAFEALFSMNRWEGAWRNGI